MLWMHVAQPSRRSSRNSTHVDAASPTLMICRASGGLVAVDANPAADAGVMASSLQMAMYGAPRGRACPPATRLRGGGGPPGPPPPGTLGLARAVALLGLTAREGAVRLRAEDIRCTHDFPFGSISQIAHTRTSARLANSSRRLGVLLPRPGSALTGTWEYSYRALWGFTLPHAMRLITNWTTTLRCWWLRPPLSPSSARRADPGQSLVLIAYSGKN